MLSILSSMSRRADRIFLFDRQIRSHSAFGSFEGERAIRFATHLHCSGSVRDLGGGLYRLTGGQANLIAGTKAAAKVWTIVREEKSLSMLSVVHLPRR